MTSDLLSNKQTTSVTIGSRMELWSET